MSIRGHAAWELSGILMYTELMLEILISHSLKRDYKSNQIMLEDMGAKIKRLPLARKPFIVIDQLITSCRPCHRLEA
jgi:hypothetical protein